jgi:hypothetical protein
LIRSGRAHRYTKRAASFLLLIALVPAANGQTVSGHAVALFDDDFTSLPLHYAWHPGDKWQLIAPGDPIGRGGKRVFNEAGDQWWTNPFNPSTSIPGGMAPAPLYSVDKNGLNLQLQSLPTRIQAYVNARCECANLAYAGTLLNTSRTAIRVYGYTEMQVAVDRVHGFAFQADEEAFPARPVWPPEIDWPKIWTDASGVQWLQGVVNRSHGVASPSYTTSSNSGFDPSAMHVYGVDWQPRAITLYLDGAQVLQTPTPTTDNYRNGTPAFWYLLTGANYYGEGDPSVGGLPAHAHVKYFRTYAEKPGAVATCQPRRPGCRDAERTNPESPTLGGPAR